ncbi:MAG TPA: hypothetical protein DCQ06_05090 [Myxococcales bacterium]|nr:hypothetical protein [Myxococcales bacterium]
MNDERERRLREAKRLEEAIFRVRLAQAFRRQTWWVWCVGVLVFTLSALVISGSEIGLSALSRRLMLQGALFTERVYAGEWWRLLSGTWIHLNWQHLVVNLTGIVLVGRHVEIAFGGSGFLSLYLAASLVGACATLVSGHPLSIGASGGLFGLLGAFVAVGARLWRHLGRQLRNSLIGVPVVVIVGMFLLNLAHEQGPRQTDEAAHVGGLLAGLAMGLALPLRLVDAEGYALEPQAPRWQSVMVRILAISLSTLALVALVMVWRQSSTSPSLERPILKTLVLSNASIEVPKTMLSGVWRQGKCEGSHVDPGWTLQHSRIACFELPMTGRLLIGLPQQLLTLDKADVAAVSRGRDEMRFVWRQNNVLVAPAGGPYIYVVLGHEAMLKSYGQAFAEMLPPRQSVVVPTLRSRAALRATPQNIALPEQLSPGRAP